MSPATSPAASSGPTLMSHLMAACGSITFWGAFIAGAAGSVHCLAMCGSLSGALGLRAQRLGAGAARAFGHGLTYQLGRLSGYALCGAVVGAAGGSLKLMFDVARLSVGMRTLAGLVMMAAAIGILSRWRPLAWLERGGGRLWGRIAPLGRRIPAGGWGGSMLLGVLWGFLPCGMVYSMLLMAALAGSAAAGAATMLCFGLGTVPAVLGAGSAGAAALRLAGGRRLQVAAGALLLTFGAVTVVMTLSLAAGHSHSPGSMIMPGSR